MAKNQLLALNIPKLSGQCGKLMCCLKYEDEAYTELREGLPKQNAQVEYEGKMYRVTSMNVITRTCKLENRETALFITLDELAEKGTFKKREAKQPKLQEVRKEEPVEVKDEAVTPVVEKQEGTAGEIKTEPIQSVGVVEKVEKKTEETPVEQKTRKERPNRSNNHRRQENKERGLKEEKTEKQEKIEHVNQPKPERKPRNDHKDRSRKEKSSRQTQNETVEKKPQGEKRSFKKEKVEAGEEKPANESLGKRQNRSRPHHNNHHRPRQNAGKATVEKKES